LKVLFNIKIEESDLKLLQNVAKKRGQDASVFARFAIRKELARLGFLKKDEAKALEMI